MPSSVRDLHLDRELGPPPGVQLGQHLGGYAAEPRGRQHRPHRHLEVADGRGHGQGYGPVEHLPERGQDDRARGALPQREHGPGVRAADVVVVRRIVGEPDHGPDPALGLGRHLDELDPERAGERHGVEETGRDLARVDAHARTLLASNFPGKTPEHVGRMSLNK